MHWNFGDNPENLATELAHAVANDLRAALRSRDAATLALSGGNTPKQFMQCLSLQKLDWDKVTVTLVDERWVPPDHPRANAGLLRKHLLREEAAHAHFVPLYVEAPTPEDGLAQVRARIDTLALPLDVVVLGMGDDGHTASFFPGGDQLRNALDPKTPERVVSMRAPHAGEPRITLTLPLLVGAHARYLLITGESKRNVLLDAMKGGDYPISAVLEAAPELQTYWCP
jgi:6-phosphogluconolactonase